MCIYGMSSNTALQTVTFTSKGSQVLDHPVTKWDTMGPMGPMEFRKYDRMTIPSVNLIALVKLARLIQTDLIFFFGY